MWDTIVTRIFDATMLVLLGLAFAWGSWGGIFAFVGSAIGFVMFLGWFEPEHPPYLPILGTAILIASFVFELGIMPLVGLAILAFLARTVVDEYGLRHVWNEVLDLVDWIGGKFR